jgi:hypothetical protein
MMASKNQNTQRRKRAEEKKQVPQAHQKITKTKRKTEENPRK